jgi:methylated-DNA-[protein]-cysteine S-methyltransferase
MYAPDYGEIATPIGTIVITVSQNSLESIKIAAHAPLRAPMSPLVREAAMQISAWFAGEAYGFSLPLAPPATEHAAILRAGMINIRYGHTISYGALACHVGSGARAVGQACARNPFPIIVPCHRVLAAGGVLGAYSAGEGPATKAWLLEFERKNQPDID